MRSQKAIQKWKRDENGHQEKRREEKGRERDEKTKARARGPAGAAMQCISMLFVG